jgi:hypothetical protein
MKALRLALAVLGGLSACNPAGWHGAPEAPRAPSLLHGDLRCDGQADCSVCAEDVAGQFANSDWRPGADSWHFQPFLPHGAVTAEEAYDGGLHDHVQGFVRLDGPGERFAMIHSGGRSWRWQRRFASLSLIVERGDGRNWLQDVRPVAAQDAHTSGIFTLGRYIGLLQRDGGLAFLDVAQDLQGPLLEHQLPIADPKPVGLSPWSGGVAMTRLAEGGYLLLANEGGNGASSGHSHFFRVGGDLFHPGSPSLTLQPLGEFQYPKPPRGPSDYHHSENLALITECGTGDLYSIHVGSSDYLYRFQQGRTFWRVSRVVIAEQSATLEPVGVYTRTATLQRCFGRAAGNAFVQPDHRIELLCHEWKHVRTELPVWRFWRNRSTAPDNPSAAEAPPGAL